MADFNVRLNFESKEYENNLKRASRALVDMAKEAERTGASLAYADKEELAFVKSLGQMQTVANSTKGSLREMQQTIQDLTVHYQSLSQVDRQSQYGQSLKASIDELVQRAGVLKDVMDDTAASIKNAASDTAFTDGVSLMTRTIGSCASAMVAWTGDSKEMEQVIKDLAKIQTTIQAVEGLTKAFQKQNLVLLKNPYVAAAAAVVALGTALYEVCKRMNEMDASTKAVKEAMEKGRDACAKEVTQIDILNERLHDNTLSLDERKAALDAIQDLVPDYHGALDEEGRLIDDNSDAISNYVDELQRAATAQAAYDRLVELGRKKLDLELAKKKAQQDVNNAGMTTVVTGGAGSIASVSAQGADISSARNRLNSINTQIVQNQAEQDALKSLIKTGDVAGKGSGTLRRESSTNTSGTGWSYRGSRRNGSSGTSSGTTERVLVGDIEKQEELVRKLGVAWSQAVGEDARNAAKSALEEAENKLRELKGETKEAIADVQIEENKLTGSIDAANERLSDAKSLLDSAAVGSEEWFIAQKAVKDATDELADLSLAKALQELKEMNNLDIDLTDIFSTLADGGNVDNWDWSELENAINQQLEELKLDPISLDFETGEVKKKAKEVADTGAETAGSWQYAAQAISQVGGAIQQIENPAAKVAGIVAEAVANIALSFASSLKDGKMEGGTWGWIAAAAAGVATMVSTISAIKSATSGSYASGGIIPGTSFSGDNMLANVNSGELILNRAQQSSLAGQLQQNGLGAMSLQTTISGEQIRVALSNSQRRRGRGEYVTSK